jgi:hypothetical protein
VKGREESTLTFSIITTCAAARWSPFADARTSCVLTMVAMKFCAEKADGCLKSKMAKLLSTRSFEIGEGHLQDVNEANEDWKDV